MKRTIPLLLTFLTGMFFMIQFFVPKLDEISNAMQRSIIIISAFALLIAIGNMLLIHSSILFNRKKNWGFSAILLTAFVFTLIMGIIDEANVQGETNFGFIYKFIYNPLQSTMFSMLAFYVASAAFRAFRVKTKEATLMLSAGMLVMLGRVPIGAVIWDQFPAIQSWIMNVPATASMTAIGIGVAIGAVSMSLKIIFGLERAYMGGGE